MRAFVFYKGGVASLVQLLTSDLQDVLVNAVRCIRELCVACPRNQTTVALCRAIPQLVHLLSVNSGTVLMTGRKKKPCHDNIKKTHLLYIVTKYHKTQIA